MTYVIGAKRGHTGVVDLLGLHRTGRGTDVGFQDSATVCIAGPPLIGGRPWDDMTSPKDLLSMGVVSLSMTQLFNAWLGDHVKICSVTICIAGLPVLR